MKPITVALAGNPNAGKTTIFNALTGARQHVGNYPGITVEKKTGRTEIDGETISVVDLPGTYSLTAYSQEEVVARRMLTEEKPDVVIHVIDAGALERNLYFTVQLLELGIPVVLALNMMDEVRRRGDRIDSSRLSHLLGIPVVETVGRTGAGVTEALRSAVAVGKEHRGDPWEPRVISYGTDIDPVLEKFAPEVARALEDTGKNASVIYPPRWIALKFLENDPDIRESGILSDEMLGRMDAEYEKLSRHLAGTLLSSTEAVIADFRYGYINGILRQDVIVRHAEAAARRNFSDQADRYLTHNLLGIVMMAVVFYLVYQIAFTLGAYPMDLVEGFFASLASIMDGVLPDGLVKSLIVSGVIKGAGGVMVFVPLIFIMFFLIAFLEDSGYMARIAYMLDRVFRLFGLHGSSIMPYIISGGIAGGCAVPGVMATRTLRSPMEKLATMLTLPFMACGAKIPVFLLVVGAFFAEEHQAAIMLGITLAGWGMALLAARVMRSTIIRGAPTPFVMELPPYRLPTLRGLLLHTWERGWQYLKKAGTIILAISVILWALMTFPGLPQSVSEGYDKEIALAENALAEKDPGAEKERDALEALRNAKGQAALLHSVAGRIGVALEPVTRHAGFEWKTNIALLGGFAAKEVLVSTLGTAYALGNVDPEESDSLRTMIREDPHWNKANAASLLIFVLLYAPCVVTIAAMRSETNTWRWPVFSLAASTVLAYVMAVAVYQVGRAFL